MPDASPPPGLMCACLLPHDIKMNIGDCCTVRVGSLTAWSLLPWGDYFLQILTFDINFLWIGPKTQNFVPATICYVHYCIQPCTIFVYKSLNLVLANCALSQIAENCTCK